MKYLKFTVKERKLIVIFMIINCFAFFVNYFGLSPKIKNSNNNYYVCFFTNSVKTEDYLHKTNLVHYSAYTFEDSFYPFVKFQQSWYNGYYFNGIFPFYDSSEFLIYTIIIFGFFITKKLVYNKKEDVINQTEFEKPTIKKETNYKKTKEYKQLRNLYELEIINDDEFENKVKILKRKFKKENI